MVWPSIERDAVGGRGFGFWRCWCRRLDSTEGEAKKERGKKEEGERGLNLGLFLILSISFFPNPGNGWIEAVGMNFFSFFFPPCLWNKKNKNKNN